MLNMYMTNYSSQKESIVIFMKYLQQPIFVP